MFADFWGKVPKKVSKLRARKAFEAVLSNGQATAEQLIEGVERYAQNIQTSGTEYQFIKHPATWLNDGGWEDETPKIITPLTFRSKGSPVYSKGRVLAEFYEETMEEIRREYRHAE